GGDGGNGRRVDAQRLDPADDERGAPAEGFAGVNVLAPGLRKTSRELGEEQGAEERQPTAEHPGDEGEGRSSERGGDRAGGAKDPRADDDADDHGQAVSGPERALELSHAGRPSHASARYASVRLAVAGGRAPTACPCGQPVATVEPDRADIVMNRDIA